MRAGRGRIVWMGVLALLAVAGADVARAAQCPDGMMDQLPAGGGEDLEVVGACTVGPGTYHYGDVNVLAGGTLTFTDSEIEFWATSILVENDGTLTAGTPEAPIGTAGGRSQKFAAPVRSVCSTRSCSRYVT